MINKPIYNLFARADLTEEEVLALVQRSQEFSSLPDEERLQWLDFRSPPGPPAPSDSPPPAGGTGGEWGGEGLLQNRRNRCVVLVRRPDGSPVCVKRYRCRGRWDALLGALGRSRARLAWRNADRLREHGFAVLRPVALFEEKASLLIKDSYLISPALDHRTRLDHYIAEHFAEPLPPAALRQKRRLLRSLARFLRDLHEQGIYYREMQIDNFFVEERETGKLGNWAAKQGKLGNQPQPPEPDFLISQLPSATSGTPEWNFLFVDFDRVVFGKRLSFPQRAKNLAVLRATCQMLIPQCVSETDQVRFSLAYLEGTALRRRARELLAQARELTARYLRLDQ